MHAFRYKTALLIDDDHLDTMIHTKLIQNLFFAEQIVTTHSAKEALDFLTLTNSYNHKLPDVIFLDINMPIMNGFEFLEQLAKLSLKDWRKMKIIMLSSTIYREELEKINTIPYIDKFIRKPLTPEALMQLL